MLNKNEVATFIIDVSIIDPLQSIIDRLEESKFRDVDIPWLNEQLKKFTKIAIESLGHKKTLPPIPKFYLINTYVTEWYVKNFTILINFFKSVK